MNFDDLLRINRQLSHPQLLNRNELQTRRCLNLSLADSDGPRDDENLTIGYIISVSSIHQVARSFRISSVLALFLILLKDVTLLQDNDFIFSSGLYIILIAN